MAVERRGRGEPASGHGGRDRLRRPTPTPATRSPTAWSGDGSTDNALFIIDGNTLKTAATLDHETRVNHSVRVRATDQDGLYTEWSLTISVLDVGDFYFSNHVVPAGPAAGDRGGNVQHTDPPGSALCTALSPARATTTTPILPSTATR